MAAAQRCVRLKGSASCAFHPEQKVILECEDCPGTLVCSVCTATLHKRHAFRELKDAVEDKTDKLISFIQKTKQEKLPELVQQLKLTTNKLKKNKQENQDSIAQVKQHGEKLKMEVDLNTAKKVSKLELIQKENNDMLEQHCQVIEQLQTQLMKAINECDRTLKTGTKTLIYDIEPEITSSLPTSIPPMPAVITSTFTPCRNIKPHIDLAFGEVKEYRTAKQCTTLGTKLAVVKDTSQPAQISIDRFLHQAKTLHEQQLSYVISPNCICPTSNNMTWTRGYDNKLHLVDNKGVEHKTLELDVEFGSISIDPTSHELHCICSEDHSVRRINTSTGETTVMFITEERPLVIACMDNNRMVVYTEDEAGRRRRVCLCTKRGKLLNSYIYKGEKPPYISVCHNTNNIALLGRDDGLVTVLSVVHASLQMIYKYRGQGLDQMKHANRTNSKQFCSYTAVFVDKYLLLGDYFKDTIHVLTSSSGDFLHHIKSNNMSCVAALCVQQDGVLWVGCQGHNKLLCIKYFE